MERAGPGFLINLLHWIALSLLDLLFRVFNRVEVHDREHIPSRGERGVLFLSNHISALDPFLIGITAMPRFSPVWWRAAAKEELFTRVFSRAVMYLIGAFPVKRRQRDIGSMDRMAEVLKTDVLVVFPEGTWSSTGEMLPGRPGVGKVIYDARPPKIIPVAVKGTDEILPRGSWIPRIGRRAAIIYGPPMDLERFYQRPPDLETSQQIVNAVMEEIRRLHALL
ncbi:MAG: 1-acyl-sn-glycerol-3-phosphate acyltransferase [Nitrospirae bacterium]|nr:1-acyl-sn-glycerol-3-phosphate acyltransferase [Nitrospirota bacterium]